MRVLCVVPVDVLAEQALFVGLKQKGIDIHVISGKQVEPYSSRLKDVGIPVNYLSIKKRIDLKASRYIRSILLSKRFDIIYAFNNKTVSNALFASRSMDIKFIAYRGIVGNVSFINPGSWLTYLHPRVDRICCVANAIRDCLLKMRFLGLRIEAKKLLTIYKGHDLAWYQNKPQDLSVFGIDKDAFVIACVANYRPRKGVRYLLDALSYLPATLNIQLLLIGDMRDAQLQKRIRHSPYRDRIHVLGFRSDAPEIQAACDVCVLPSIKREGLPKSIIEGMAYGVAPIVTDAGGSPELIEQGISGLIVPPCSSQAIAEAILELYHQPEKRQKIAAAARRRIHVHFNMQDTVTQTYRLFNELLAEKNDPSAVESLAQLPIHVTEYESVIDESDGRNWVQAGSPQTKTTYSNSAQQSNNLGLGE